MMMMSHTLFKSQSYWTQLKPCNYTIQTKSSQKKCWFFERGENPSYLSGEQIAQPWYLYSITVSPVSNSGYIGGKKVLLLMCQPCSKQYFIHSRSTQLRYYSL